MKMNTLLFNANKVRYSLLNVNNNLIYFPSENNREQSIKKEKTDQFMEV